MVAGRMGGVGVAACMELRLGAWGGWSTSGPGCQLEEENKMAFYISEND